MKKYVINRVNTGFQGNLISFVFIVQAENDEDLEENLYKLYCCKADTEYVEYEELDDFLQREIMVGHTITYDYLEANFGKESND